MKTKFLTLIMALSLSAFSQAPAYVPQAGLLGWWPLDNSPTDVHTNSLGGALVGAPSPTANRCNIPNTAYWFNGSNYITVANNAILSGFNDMSISLWVNAPGGSGIQGLVTKWMQSNPTCIPGNPAMADTYGVWLLSSNSTDYANNNNVMAGFTTPPVIGLNQWVHVVATSHSTLGQKMYVNGVLAATRPAGSLGSICNTAGPLSFGAENSGISSLWRFFTGSLDDIGIWNRVLTDCEILRLYNTGCCDMTIFAPPTPTFSGSGCCLGNLCSAAQNPLVGNYEVPMKNFNFNFTVPSGNTSQVLIGYPTCTSSLARLDVTDDNQGTAINGFCSTATQNNFGVRGESIDGSAFPGVNLTSVGVEGVSNQIRYPQSKQIGVAGFCGGPAVYPAGITGQNIGIYGNSTSNGGVWAGYFDGDVMISGVPYSTAGGPFTASDIRFKKEIKQLSHVSDKLKTLKGYTYKFNTEEFKERNFSDQEQIGLLAQELKEVFPQLVSEKDGYNFVNYSGLIPVLLEGFKEQQQQLDNQKQLIEQLMAKVGNSTGLNPMNPIETGFQMSQNEPNPFTHETAVRYTLPTTVSNAFMAVYDLTGKQIATFPIDQKGSSSLTITSEKLAAGIYIYSIVADGKVLDSKRMIVAEK